MNQAYVTLEEVMTAASARAASLVSETAGYLVLALGDAIVSAPCALDERAVIVSSEGHVTITRRGPARSSEQGAAQLRSILAKLLAVGTSTPMPSLAAAARPRSSADRGVEAVVHEIEAALIPVNRAAAQRALARLARETLRARESGKLSRATLPPPVPSAPLPSPRVVRVRASAPRVAVEAPAFEETETATPLVSVDVVDAIEAVEAMQPVDPVELALSASATPPSPVMVRDDASDGSSSAVTTIPSHVVSAAVFRGDDLPLIRTITPAPPGVLGCGPLDRVTCDHTPTLLGVVAPVAMGNPGGGFPKPLPSMGNPGGELPKPLPAMGNPGGELSRPLVGRFVEHADAESPIPEDVETELKTVVEARVDFATPLPPSHDGATISVARTPTPSALAAVLAHPTEDAGTAFELDLAPRLLQVASVAELEARDAREAACMAPLPEAKPTRADDLIARFGMSCVDDASLAATRASLRKMAGLDLTPPPPSAPVPTSSEDRARFQDVAPASRGSNAGRVSSELATFDDGEPGSVRDPRPRPARRSRAATVMAWAIVLTLGVAAIYRFVPEASGIVMLARDMLRPVPAPTPVAPPKATPSVEAPAPASAPASTAAPSTERVDRGTTRAERGTSQRQR